MCVMCDAKLRTPNDIKITIERISPPYVILKLGELLKGKKHKVTGFEVHNGGGKWRQRE